MFAEIFCRNIYILRWRQKSFYCDTMITVKKERTKAVNTCDKNRCVIRSDEREDDLYLYSYELTMRRGNDTASFRIPLYSVSVRMTDAYGREDRATLTDAFSDIKKARAFYEKVVNHLATPIDLSYAFEDEAII